MPKPKKITAAVLKKIPMLIEAGLSPADIAARVGCTLGTLRVVCSKAKISLRKFESNKRRQSLDTLPKRTHQSPMPVSLPGAMIDMLQQEAAKRGLAVATFASVLVEIITQENLYDAVLDEREPNRDGRRGRAVS